MFAPSPYIPTTPTGAAEGSRDSQKPLPEPPTPKPRLLPLCLDFKAPGWDLFKGTISDSSFCLLPVSAHPDVSSHLPLVFPAVEALGQQLSIFFVIRTPLQA